MAVLWAGREEQRGETRSWCAHQCFSYTLHEDDSIVYNVYTARLGREANICRPLRSMVVKVREKFKRLDKQPTLFALVLPT